VLPPPISKETVQITHTLHQHAKEGVVIGMAGAILLKGGRCTVTMCGEVANNPLFALGLVRVLESKLAAQVEENHYPSLF